MRLIPSSVPAIASAIKLEPTDTVRLVEDMQSDEMFTLARGTLVSQAVGVSVSATPNNQDVVRPANADAVERSVLDAWDRYVAQATTGAIEYGRQAFEVVYRYDGDAQANVIDRLISIPFALSKLVVSKTTGEMLGLSVGRGGKGTTIDRGSYWWATHEATDLEPYGRSRYRGAPYQVRQRRKEAIKNIDAFDRRHAMGVGIARAPMELPSGTGPVGKGKVGEINTANEAIDPMDVLRKQIESIKTGGTLVLPSEKWNTDRGGDYYYSFERPPEVKVDNHFGPRLDKLDVAALRSMGVPERSVINDAEMGARAIAEAHQSILAFQVERIVREIILTFQRDVVDVINAMNWGDGYALQMTWIPVGKDFSKAFNQIILEALKAPQVPPLLLWGVVEFIDVAESLGLPIGEDARGKMQALAQQSMQAAAAPAAGLPGGFGQLALDAVDIFQDSYAAAGELIRRQQGELGTSDDGS